MKGTMGDEKNWIHSPLINYKKNKHSIGHPTRLSRASSPFEGGSLNLNHLSKTDKITGVTSIILSAD